MSQGYFLSHSVVDVGSQATPLRSLILALAAPETMVGFFQTIEGRAVSGVKLVTYTIPAYATPQTFDEMDIAAYAVSPANSMSPDGVVSGIPKDATTFVVVSLATMPNYSTDGLSPAATRLNPTAS